MKDFEFDKRVILKIIEEFIEKYNYLSKNNQDSIYAIITQGEEDIEKLRNEYNPSLEDELICEENTNNIEGKPQNDFNKESKDKDFENKDNKEKENKLEANIESENNINNEKNENDDNEKKNENDKNEKKSENEKKVNNDDNEIKNENINEENLEKK